MAALIADDPRWGPRLQMAYDLLERLPPGERPPERLVGEALNLGYVDPDKADQVMTALHRTWWRSGEEG